MVVKCRRCGKEIKQPYTIKILNYKKVQLVDKWLCGKRLDDFRDWFDEGAE